MNDGQTTADIAIIVPACDEAPVIARVLEELMRTLDSRRCAVVVGVNGSRDETSAIARKFTPFVAETSARGYGHGCTAAIELADRALPSLDACIFFAADGASDPADVARLIAARDGGSDFVLGVRTTSARNWRAMSLPHVAANFALAAWCGLLAGRPFKDLAPLRLISRDLLRAIAPREMTFGWTIESQIAAAKLGASICEVTAHERPRLAGEQKVSGVTWARTLNIGCKIMAAGWRTARRFRSAQHVSPRRVRPEAPKDLVPQRGS